MKMPRIKFEWSFLTVLLFPLLLDFASGAIQLSHHKATKVLGANFMVTCRDDSGRSVSWSGPKGPLGTKTHPGVEVSSYGTSLVFMSITKEDRGTYTCRVGQENAQFHLTVEGCTNAAHREKIMYNEQEPEVYNYQADKDLHQDG